MTAPTTLPGTTRLVPGCIVGNKYRIDGCLGEGGMGVVLSATHLELDAPVAIKVVREEFAGSDYIVERVLFEARAVARMRSNHVVRVLDVARLDDGCPYIVMEQLQGVDLGVELWENGPLSAPKAIDYLLQACDGLAEAHSLGIVHRDLKPGNLFLAKTPEGVVLKVLDFGISKEVSSPLRATRLTHTSLTSAGDPVGSPYYMAPEQMRASPDVDARADIWSLGAILFELLTGQCPFEGETMAEVCGKVLAEAPPSLSTFPHCTAPELDAVIARCLEKDPNHRYQTVGELAQALRAWRPSEDVELPAEPPKARPRRSRLPLAMVGLSAALVLGGVELWQRHGSAASLDSQRMRPVIAAAANPIWHALPAPPLVPQEPVPSALSAAPKSTSTDAPTLGAPTLGAPTLGAPTLHAFQTAALRETPVVPPAGVQPAVIQTRAPALATDTDAPAQPPEPSEPAKVSGDDSASGEAPETAPDPVSGRYGL